MDLIVLLIVNSIMRYYASAGRLLLSSTLGAIWSVVAVMLPERYRLFVNLCTYFIVTSFMLLTIHSPLNIIRARKGNTDKYALRNYLKELLKGMIVMLSVACLIGGVLHILVYYTYTGWIVRNILVTGGQLVTFVFTAMPAIALMVYTLRVHRRDAGMYKVTIMFGDERIMLQGIVDTGNQLVDIYTGKPVSVMDKSYFEKVLYKIKDYERLKYHLIPYRTIGNNEGMIEVITSDYMYISNRSETKAYKGALIGLSDKRVSQRGEYQALINGHMS